MTFFENTNPGYIAFFRHMPPGMKRFLATLIMVAWAAAFIAALYKGVYLPII
jgi:hypothetical protein